MSVVSGRARLRWGVVAAGTALLCGLPALIAAWPVPASALSAAQLRARILASADVPYQGYAESDVNLGLPNLPDLSSVSTPLDGSTAIMLLMSESGAQRYLDWLRGSSYARLGLLVALLAFRYFYGPVESFAMNLLLH